MGWEKRGHGKAVNVNESSTIWDARDVTFFRGLTSRASQMVDGGCQKSVTSLRFELWFSRL